MRCPVDEGHKGILAIKIPKQNNMPYYAKARCAKCGAWIKWLSKAQYNDLIAIIGMSGEVLETAKDHDFTDKQIQRIREIARDAAMKMMEEAIQ
jgi:hypothetical protein